MSVSVHLVRPFLDTEIHVSRFFPSLCIQFRHTNALMRVPVSHRHHSCCSSILPYPPGFSNLPFKGTPLGTVPFKLPRSNRRPNRNHPSFSRNPTRRGCSLWNPLSSAVDVALRSGPFDGNDVVVRHRRVGALALAHFRAPLGALGSALRNVRRSSRLPSSGSPSEEGFGCGQARRCRRHGRPSNLILVRRGVGLPCHVEIVDTHLFDAGMR